MQKIKNKTHLEIKQSILNQTKTAEIQIKAEVLS